MASDLLRMMLSQQLDKPVSEKESEHGEDTAKGFSWGCSCMQGWRLQMEDAHIAQSAVGKNSWMNVALFGVMDGHGGEHVAKFCKRHLPPTIATGKPDSAGNIGQAMTNSFHKMDDMLRTPDGIREMAGLGNRASLPWPMNARPSPQPENVGCTAVLSCITADEIITANAGDSRAVLCRGGKAVPLSFDHKPNNPVERSRITKAGGYVEVQHGGVNTQYRVNGNLNLSRAIGDLEYKKDRKLKPQEQIICSTPDITVEARQPEKDEFLIIGCDGIWDVVSNQEACDFVRPRLQKRNGKTPAGLAEICEELLDRCLSPNLASTQGLGGDNMTVVIVLFQNAAAQVLKVERQKEYLFVSVRLQADIGSGKDLVLEFAERTLRLSQAKNTEGSASQLMLVDLSLPEEIDIDACKNGNALSRFVRSKHVLKVWLALK